jgi:restriction endonuclease S subunit
MEYLNDTYIDNLSRTIDSIEWPHFHTIFMLENSNIYSSNVKGSVDGQYPFITQSNCNKWKKTNDYTIDGENLFIVKKYNKCNPIHYFNGKASYSNQLLRLNVNIKYKYKINIKFYYYYLNAIMFWIEQTYYNKLLDINNFNMMKIPLPDLEIQNKIVLKLDKSKNKVVFMRAIVQAMENNSDTFFEWLLI